MDLAVFRFISLRRFGRAAEGDGDTLIGNTNQTVYSKALKGNGTLFRHNALSFSPLRGENKPKTHWLKGLLGPREVRDHRRVPRH
jgi:hypothetical protein